MKRFVCLFFVAIGLLFTVLSLAKGRDTVRLQDRNKAQYAYFEAMRLKGSGQHAAAFDLLRYAVELDTTLAAAYSEKAA